MSGEPGTEISGHVSIVHYCDRAIVSGRTMQEKRWNVSVCGSIHLDVDDVFPRCPTELGNSSRR